MRRSLALGVAIVLAAVFLPPASRPASGAQIDLSTYGVTPFEAVPYLDRGVRSTADEVWVIR